MTTSKILIAVIGAPHGVRGEMRLKALTGDPLDVSAYGALTADDGRVFEILSIRPAKEVVIVRMKGVDDRDAAQALTGTKLFVPRENLPESEDSDTFYHVDLIGLDAVDLDGRVVGRVVAVHDFGAGDLLEIAVPGKASGDYVPFTREAVPQVDIGNRRVVINPPGEFSGA